MPPAYSLSDYMEMVAYYKQCGNINITRKLYHGKYGKYPSYSIVRKALAILDVDGVSERSKIKNTMRDSKEAFENLIRMDIKEEITDEMAITEEKEDDEITIKEEAEDIFLEDSVMNENISLNQLDSDLNRCPLVYTTRLDDMQVFKKDFDSLSVQTIVDNILCESKPQLCKVSQIELRIGRNIERDVDVRSFNNILDKIEEYNHITTYVDFGACKIEDFFLIQEDDPSELCVSERSKELFVSERPKDLCVSERPKELCVSERPKQLCISKRPEVLCESKRSKELCVSERANEFNVSERSKELLKLCKPLSITLTDIKMTNQFPTFIAEISEFTHRHVDPLLLRYTHFMVEDRFLNSTDIYFFRKKFVPTYLYHLNCIVSKNSDLPVYKYLQNHYSAFGRRVYKVVNCCWHKRESNIDFIAKKFFSCESTTLMKKPHLCILSTCVCCCKTDTSYKSLLVKAQKEDTSAEREYFPHGNSVNESASSLIRALQLNLKRTNLDSGVWFDQAMRNIVNSIKNDCRNALPNTPARTFTIAQGKTVRRMASDRFELEEDAKINMYIHSPVKNIDVNDIDVWACCWWKKQSIISGLGFEAHVKNFMKMPHACQASKCLCCCSDDDTSKECTVWPLKDIELPEQPYYTKKYSSQFVSTGKSYINDVNFTQMPNILKNTKVTKSPIPVKTGPTSQPSLKVPLVPPLGSNIPDLSQDPAVNSLITSILERFKDIRLAVNADGKVFAELNTAIDTLSTDELKVLSNILARVQEQVNSLGLAGNPYVQNMIHPPTAAPAISVDNNNHEVAKTNISMPNNRDTTTNVASKGNSKTLEKLNNNILPILISNNSMSEKRNYGFDYLTCNTSNYTGSDNSKTLINLTNQQVMKPQERQNLYQNLDIELNACLNHYIGYKTLMKWKYQQYTDSFKSFITGRKGEGTPIIENVFSLSGVNETTKSKDPSTAICPDDEFSQPRPGPLDVHSRVNYEFQEPRPGPSGLSSKMNKKSEKRKSGSRRGVKRTKSNNDEQSNKKLKIKSLRELLSEGPRVPQVTPPLAAIGSSQLLRQNSQALPMLDRNINIPFIVNNQFVSDLPVQSHNNFADLELQTPSILGGNIMTPNIPPLIINNQLSSDLARQSHKNFVDMSSQLPALMPFNNPVIITNAVNLQVPTPEKTNDECILGV